MLKSVRQNQCAPLKQDVLAAIAMLLNNAIKMYCDNITSYKILAKSPEMSKFKKGPIYITDAKSATYF